MPPTAATTTSATDTYIVQKRGEYCFVVSRVSQDGEHHTVCITVQRASAIMIADAMNAGLKLLGTS